MSPVEAGWTGWRGANRDGQAAWLPSQLADKPTIVWRTPLAEVALGGLAATSTHVLVADRELGDMFDSFRCLDAATGKQLWAHRYPAASALDYGNAPRATPLIDDQRVFLLGAQGHLRCVKMTAGELVWQRNLRSEFGVAADMPWGVCGSPLLVDGKLIVNPGGPDASLAALDPATGKTLWQTPGRPASYGSFIAARMGGRLQIIGHDETTLGGWDAATGKRLWTVVPENEKDFNVPTPLVHDGRLIVMTHSGGTRLFGFDDQGQIIPQPLARFADLRHDTHTPVVAGNRIFGVNRRLICLDLRDPLKLVYEARHSSLRGHTSLIAAAERVLVCNEAGELLLIDSQADQFQLISRSRVFDDEQGLLSHPALVGHRLYLRGSRELVCVDLSE